MHRKLLRIGITLAAFGALAIGPSSALAVTHLTDTSGGVPTTVGAGKQIKAISDGISTFTGSGLSYECNENWMAGEVVKDEGGFIQETIMGVGFDSNLTENPTDCKGNLGATLFTFPTLKQNGGAGHWCMESQEGTDKFKIWGRGCNEAGNGRFAFILETTSGLKCEFTRELAIEGTVTTPTTHVASTLAVTGSPSFTGGGGFLCPATFGVTQMAFNLYTDTDPSVTPAELTEHWDDAASTADPAWLGK